jgi:DNA-binding transcriptional regulator YdaS (Cro superfamily)
MNKFHTYFLSLGKTEREQLANRLATSVAYLSLLSRGHRRAGVKITARIERATNGEILPVDLRPDLY